MESPHFFDSAYQFQEELFLSKVKLSSVTYTLDKRIKPKPNDSEKKFSNEQLRFWRRNDLLPFFQDGDHAQISMAQYLWVLFLSSMKKFGCSVEHMKLATDYFIKRAYDDNLVIKNFIRLEEFYKAVLQKFDSANTHDSEILRVGEVEFNKADVLARLAFIKQSLNDPFLLHALKMDINYFSVIILIYLEHGKEISIVMNEKGVFGISLEDELLHISYNNPIPHPTFKKDEPFLIFPIQHFLKEFFSDSSLDEKALNVQVLNAAEKDIIKNLRDKRVTSMHITLRNGEIKRYDIEKQMKRSISENEIRQIKDILGLKNYQEISLSMINEKDILQTKTIKKIL